MELGSLAAWQWAGAGLAAFLVGLSKAGFGAGAGILAVPLMAAVLGPLDMLPVMLLVLIIGDLFSVGHYLRRHDARNLAMLLPGLVLGVGAGYLALDGFLALPDADLWMRRLVGGLAVAFVLVQWFRMAREGRLAASDRPYRPRAWHGVGLGAAAGLSSTLAHAGGPIIALFLLPQRLEKRVFVGTVIKFFFIGNLIKLVPYFQKGLMSWRNASLSLALLPLVAVGSVAGVLLNRSFSDRAFRVVVYGLAFLFGLYLVSGHEPGRAAQPSDAAAGAFRRGLEAYERGRYGEAATAFRRSADAGEQRGAARAAFNAALALYRAGRYGEAEAGFGPLAQGPGAVGVRAALNLGNAAVRQGRYGSAAGQYATAAARGREALAQAAGLDAGERATIGEAVRRAEHNLRVALERAQTAGGPPSGGEAAEPRQAAERGAGGAPEGGGGAAGGHAAQAGVRSVGARGGTRPGARDLEAVLAGVRVRDSGPVLGTASSGAGTGGREW